jgi:hypothetical protein
MKDFSELKVYPLYLNGEWQEGGQYVKFSDVVVSAGQGITITVDVLLVRVTAWNSGTVGSRNTVPAAPWPPKKVVP